MTRRAVGGARPVSWYPGGRRDFERQADQLGIQYEWNAGYDTSGFICFFDKIATKEGYVNGASWFRSHPPFYQRMVESQREITYLGKKPATIVDSDEFKAMKAALTKVTAKAAEEAKDKPSLLAPEQRCAPTAKLVYEPDQPIETICATPQTKLAISSGQMQLMQAQVFLQMLAAKSGGFAWFPRTNAFHDVTEGIMQSIAAQYRIVYESKIKSSGEFKKIRWRRSP